MYETRNESRCYDNICVLMAAPVEAHQFWINLHESLAHHPGHVMISLGFGHKLPMDDYLNSPKGGVKLESYVLYDPEHKALSIPFQNPKVVDPKQVNSLSGASVRTGDIFDRKIKFSADMKPGTWQVAAAQHWDFVQAYKDKKASSLSSESC